MYEVNSKVIGRLESILRTKRHTVPESKMDEKSLKELIEKFMNPAKWDGIQKDLRNESINNFDFSKPIVISSDQYNFLEKISTSTYHVPLDGNESVITRRKLL